MILTHTRQYLKSDVIDWTFKKCFKGSKSDYWDILDITTYLFLSLFISNRRKINQLQKKAPIEIDRGLEYNWANDIAIQDHEDTFISIVTESLADKYTLFLSEKIYQEFGISVPNLLETE